jgi:hypothetical protein
MASQVAMVARERRASKHKFIRSYASEKQLFPLFLCSRLIFGFVFSFHGWKFQERSEALDFWVWRLTGKFVEGQVVSDVQSKNLVCNFRAKSANLDILYSPSKSPIQVGLKIV